MSEKSWWYSLALVYCDRPCHLVVLLVVVGPAAYAHAIGILSGDPVELTQSWLSWEEQSVRMRRQ